MSTPGQSGQSGQSGTTARGPNPLVIGIVIFILVCIAVGVGLGLTLGNDSSSSSSNGDKKKNINSTIKIKAKPHANKLILIEDTTNTVLIKNTSFASDENGNNALRITTGTNIQEISTYDIFSNYQIIILKYNNKHYLLSSQQFTPADNQFTYLCIEIESTTESKLLESAFKKMDEDPTIKYFYNKTDFILENPTTSSSVYVKEFLKTQNKKECFIDDTLNTLKDGLYNDLQLSRDTPLSLETLYNWDCSSTTPCPQGKTLEDKVCKDTITYSYLESGWSDCSATCGGGTQTQTVTCQSSNDETVRDSYCSGTKPSTSQSCNTDECDVLENFDKNYVPKIQLEFNQQGVGHFSSKLTDLKDIKVIYAAAPWNRHFLINKERADGINIDSINVDTNGKLVVKVNQKDYFITGYISQAKYIFFLISVSSNPQLSSIASAIKRPTQTPDPDPTTRYLDDFTRHDNIYISDPKYPFVFTADRVEKDFAKSETQAIEKLQSVISKNDNFLLITLLIGGDSVIASFYNGTGNNNENKNSNRKPFNNPCEIRYIDETDDSKAISFVHKTELKALDNLLSSIDYKSLSDSTGKLTYENVRTLKVSLVSENENSILGKNESRSSYDTLRKVISELGINEYKKNIYSVRYESDDKVYMSNVRVFDTNKYNLFPVFTKKTSAYIHIEDIIQNYILNDMIKNIPTSINSRTSGTLNKKSYGIILKSEFSFGRNTKYLIFQKGVLFVTDNLVLDVNNEDTNPYDIIKNTNSSIKDNIPNTLNRLVIDNTFVSIEKEDDRNKSIILFYNNHHEKSIDVNSTLHLSKGGELYTITENSKKFYQYRFTYFKSVPSNMCIVSNFYKVPSSPSQIFTEKHLTELYIKKNASILYDIDGSDVDKSDYRKIEDVYYTYNSNEILISLKVEGFNTLKPLKIIYLDDRVGSVGAAELIKKGQLDDTNILDVTKQGFAFTIETDRGNEIKINTTVNGGAIFIPQLNITMGLTLPVPDLHLNNLEPSQTLSIPIIGQPQTAYKKINEIYIGSIVDDVYRYLTHPSDPDTSYRIVSISFRGIYRKYKLSSGNTIYGYTKCIELKDMENRLYILSYKSDDNDNRSYYTATPVKNLKNVSPLLDASNFPVETIRSHPFNHIYNDETEFTYDRDYLKVDFFPPSEYSSRAGLEHGSVLSLKNQPVLCPFGYALQDYRLNTEPEYWKKMRALERKIKSGFTGNIPLQEIPKLNYQYTCIYDDAYKKNRYYNTHPLSANLRIRDYNDHPEERNEHIDYGTFALDDFHLSCKNSNNNYHEDDVIAGFKVTEAKDDYGSSVNIKTACIKVDEPKEYDYYGGETERTDYGHGKISHLDRHHIKCPEDKALKETAYRISMPRPGWSTDDEKLDDYEFEHRYSQHYPYNNQNQHPLEGRFAYDCNSIPSRSRPGSSSGGRGSGGGGRGSSGGRGS